jgi:hypothetical protein
MARKTRTTFTLNSGNGIIITQDGVGYNGSDSVINNISVGNDISTTGNPSFNQITASRFLVGNKLLSNMIPHHNGNLSVSNNSSVTGDVVIQGNLSVGGILVGEKFVSELNTSSTINESGSTKFGDSHDDVQNMTGSLQMTGSFDLNDYTIHKITNDTSLTDGSSTNLATENAIKQYAISVIGTSSDPATAEELYMRKNFNKSATSVSNNTASFTAVTASSPDGMTSTTENDFIFFHNGNAMEHDALSIEQSGSQFLLKVNPNSIGYEITSNDTIKAWGRFNA